MTAKEKALELVYKLNIVSNSTSGMYTMTNYQLVRCAIIAVNEMLNDDMYGMDEFEFNNRIDYLTEVKQELEKML